MQQTNHYQLSQWDFEDQIVMADFNKDNQKTDEALHTLAGQIGQKANSSTVSTLTTKVDTKAEKSALAEEASARAAADAAETAAREAADAALAQGHSADVAALRSENCWVKLGFWDITTAASAFDINLSDISAANYIEFRIYCHGAVDNILYLRLNNSSAEQYTTGSVNGGVSSLFVASGSSGFGGVLSLFPAGTMSTGMAYSGVNWAGSGNSNTPTAGAAKHIPFSEITTLNFFTTSGTIAAGTAFTLYGMKK